MSYEQVMNNIGVMIASGGCKNRNDLQKYKEYLQKLKEKQNPKSLLHQKK